VTHADGVSRTTHVYSGNTTTITDPAGKWKKYTYDAFGQLVKVTEPDPLHGNVDTNYTYDTLGRLTVVSMPRGAVTQSRTFTYDGSSQRLLSATNPENGTVSYAYKRRYRTGTAATRWSSTACCTPGRMPKARRWNTIMTCTAVSSESAGFRLHKG
jgi:YD repeat-containing protein